MGWALNRSGFVQKSIKVPGHGVQRLYLVWERDMLNGLPNPKLSELWSQERAGKAGKFTALRRPQAVEGGKVAANGVTRNRRGS